MLIRVTITDSIAQDTPCGFTYQGSPIIFTAPLDVLIDDIAVVDTRDGQLYAVWRPSVGLVWALDVTGTWAAGIDWGALLVGDEKGTNV